MCVSSPFIQRCVQFHNHIFRSNIRAPSRQDWVIGTSSLLDIVIPDFTLVFRFVLASTQDLHEKIAHLANRVRQLEDGLRVSHAQISTEQHPLLSDELLKIKAPIQRDATHLKPVSIPAVKEEENNLDAVDASGSLSIGQSGKTKFYGQTANSWVCVFVNLSLLNLPDVTITKTS